VPPAWPRAGNWPQTPPVTYWHDRTMTDQLSVDVVRVFTTASGDRGNELGIIESSVASAGSEQQLARDLGFSETVFVDAVADGIATIRIFTPASELPFAGHPSVGTAWWLARSGSPVHTLREKAGDVQVRTDGDLTWITGRAAWAPEFVWLPKPSRTALAELEPDSFGAGQHYAWAWTDESTGSLAARMFAPAMNIREDEATGAAAVAITALLGRDLTITQGSGSQLFTRLLDHDRVEVGGRTVFDRVVGI
jgi:predicted PhzF superfamily epimerase YddE/YHI9